MRFPAGEGGFVTELGAYAVKDIGYLGHAGSIHVGAVIICRVVIALIIVFFLLFFTVGCALCFADAAIVDIQRRNAQLGKVKMI